MRVHTEQQELLMSYLVALKTPLIDQLLIMGMLWDEEATMEMLQHISKTHEKDPDKLYSVACEIEEKYKAKDSFDEGY